MKLQILALAVVFLFSGSAAHAVTLHNKDSRSYDIRVTGSSAMSTSIQSGTVKNRICSSCNIEVSGVGDIDVSRSDYVIIRVGKLSLK